VDVLSWPMHRHDPQRSGRSAFAGPDRPSVRWRARGDGFRFHQPTVGADGAIAAYADDRSVYLVGPDGDVRWRHPVGKPVGAEPAFGADGTVYIGCGDGDFNVRAVSAGGTLLWGEQWGTALQTRPVVGHDGTIYITSSDDSIHAVSGEGQELWSIEEVDARANGITLASDSLLLQEDRQIFDERDSNWRSNYYLVALSLGGELLWQREMGGELVGNVLVGADGTIYVSAADHTLSAFSGQGEPLWSADVRCGSPVGAPALGPDGMLLVACSEGAVVAFPRDGSEAWIADTGAYLTTGPAVDRRGWCYVGGKRLIALDPDGGIRWRFDGFRTPVAGIAIGAGDAVVFGADRLYALSGAGTVSWALRTETSKGIFSTILAGERGVYANLGYCDISLLDREGVEVARVDAFADCRNSPYMWHPDWLNDVLGSCFLSGEQLCLATDTVRLWRPAEPQTETVLSHGRGALRWCVALSEAEGTLLAAYKLPESLALQVICFRGVTVRWHTVLEPGPVWIEGLRGGAGWTEPAVSRGGTLFLGCTDGSVHALSAEGEALWRFALPDAKPRMLAVAAADTLLLVVAQGSEDSIVYALDMAGELRWRTGVGPSGARAIFLAPDGRICVPDAQGTVHILASDGRVLALLPTNADRWRDTQVMDARGVLYYCGGDTIYATSLTGERLWEHALGAMITAPLALDRHGTLYAGCEDGYLYALG